MSSKKVVILIITLGLLGGVFLVYNHPPRKEGSPAIKENGLEVRSPAFDQNQTIPTKYTCDGKGVNPVLKIKNVPGKATSLVLIVEDPDAPRGPFIHWVVFNINPSITEVAEGETPKGAVEGMNDFEDSGYGAVCPPEGDGVHHYHFKLYALGKKVDLGSSTSEEAVKEAMEDSVLDSAELIGVYER